MSAIDRIEDIVVLERLFEEFSGWHIERSASIQKAIAHCDGELLVAEIDGQVIGFVHQVLFEDPLIDRYAEYIKRTRQNLQELSDLQ